MTASLSRDSELVDRLRRNADFQERMKMGNHLLLADAADAIERLRMTLRAVNDNACAWHSGEDGKARSLNVIAVWTSEAIAGRIHPSVEVLTK